MITPHLTDLSSLLQLYQTGKDEHVRANTAFIEEADLYLKKLEPLLTRLSEDNQRLLLQVTTLEDQHHQFNVIRSAEIGVLETRLKQSSSELTHLQKELDAIQARDEASQRVLFEATNRIQAASQVTTRLHQTSYPSLSSENFTNAALDSQGYNWLDEMLSNLEILGRQTRQFAEELNPLAIPTPLPPDALQVGVGLHASELSAHYKIPVYVRGPVARSLLELTRKVHADRIRKNPNLSQTQKEKEISALHSRPTPSFLPC